MPELSQLLRQRLASRVAAGDHPDADTLTAYTEQLLSQGERKRVLEHVAVCGECREVLALSLPETVESLPVPALAPRRGWRWKPVFGLAASLAAVAAITTVVIELPKKPATFQSARQPVTPANTAEADRLNSAGTPTQPESATPNNFVAGELRATPSRPAESRPSIPSTGRDVVAMRVAPVPPPPVLSVAADAASSPNTTAAQAKLPQHDYVNKQMFDAAQNSNEAVPSVAELPAAPLPGFAQAQLSPPLSGDPLSLSEFSPQSGKVLPGRQLSNSPGSRFGLGLIPNLPALGRKAEAKAGAMARRTLAIPPGALTFSTMESSALNPSREEQLQSADGNRAQTGDLDQSSAFSQRALAGGQTYAISLAAAWKVAGGRLLKSTDSTTWNAGYGPGDIDFTVVASRGAHIWAGGANAALVHSADGGASWERITLGSSATGSITSIEFGGSNVRVKSSSGQEWSSYDGGKTWAMEK
jgi:Photosynthesis system II assembly factor YCF48/Putative zinc-finger